MGSDNHNTTEDATWIAYFVVFIVPGLILAGMAGLAARRFSGFSVEAIFLAGWIGSLLFSALIKWTTKNA